MPARPSGSKRDRERAKKAKAESKRSRRQERVPAEGPEGVEERPTAGDDHDGILSEINAMQAAFDRGEISFEDYDERKRELLEAIVVE